MELDRQKINLYVDDLRDCPEKYIIARNVSEAIYYLEKYDVEILSLDHDLGEDNFGNLMPSGYDLVKYMCKNAIMVKKIFIHTDNPVGRENMYETLVGAQRMGFIDSDVKIYNYAFTKNKCSS